jgi:predicted N-acyltransferase
LTVTVLHTAQEIPRERWDALAGDSVYNAHGWQQYQERSQSLDTRFVVVSDGDDWSAAASVFIVRDEANPLYRPPGPGGEASNPASTVLVGNRRGYANRLLRAEASRTSIGTLVSSVHEVARRFGHDHVWWMFLDTDSAEKLLPWSSTTVPWLLEGDCSIDLPGHDFDDFLASTTANIRKRIRRDRLLFERAGYRTAELDLADCWPDVARLVDELASRHGATSTGTDELLRLQAEAMGQAAKVDACFCDDTMVGANLRFDGNGETVSREHNRARLSAMIAEGLREQAIRHNRHADWL